jgi:hypothetical protein
MIEGVTHNPDLIPCATRIFPMDYGRLKIHPGTPPCRTEPAGSMATGPWG